MRARAIFVGGTASNVGKSWMATALCRHLARLRFRVAPFKAQNMSNNSYPCVGGGEIGRSQVAQAEACGVEPESAMNPVLLKPTGDSISQVILHGKVWRNLHAREYYEHTDFLRAEALTAFSDLASRFDVVVIEGAGSVAELNLRSRDFVNMSMAQAVGARALLVADIERGGVFASILGTVALLAPEERELLRCFAVNRFRGDRTLFADGVSILEERSGLPCLGVFPFAPDIRLGAEDSLAESVAATGNPTTAIIRFPRVSNTTDFGGLRSAIFLDRPDDRCYDVVVLPGTKSTIADLRWMRETGFDSWVLGQHENGASVIGICGGYQMLGRSVSDPSGEDGTVGFVSGLGLLPVDTVMDADKTTRVRRGTTAGGVSFEAYEIHLGRTQADVPCAPFAFLEDGSPEGVRCGRVVGTYLHGALESAAVWQELTGAHAPAEKPRSQSYDALADWLTAHASATVLASLLD